MSQGYRQVERFWISFVVRFAFGFLFLIAALNVFTYLDTKNLPPDPNRGVVEYVKQGVTHFKNDLSKPYAKTWVNFKWKFWPAKYDEKTGTTVGIDLGKEAIDWFLIGMPFIFFLLAFCFLTGFALRPAMRFGAFYLVLLGLGKYVTGDAATTLQDFFFAFLLCLGLYLSSEEKQASKTSAASAPPIPGR